MADRRPLEPKGLPIPGDALPPGLNDAGQPLRGGMSARRLPNGNLLVPKRAETEDGNFIGDGMVEVEPGTPEYEMWISFVAESG
jgi:hypothetical protein